MRPRHSLFAGRQRHGIVGPTAVVVASSLLAACASSSDGGGKVGGRLFGPKDPNRAVATVQQEYGPEFFMKSGYCPPVQIRAGTEALVTYERNHEKDPDFVQFQGSITKTARECHAVDADTLTVKVGIAGRVVAGPKGNAGSVTLPLRIAVVKQHGGNVFYTQEFKVPVTMTPPDFTADFSQVFDQVVFKVTPDDRDLIVYVGFDQGDAPGGPTG